MSEDHNCDISTTGVCGLHGIEIERRKAHAEELRRIESDIIENKTSVKELYESKSVTEAFNAQVKVACVIFSAIYMGSFLYTYNHKQDAGAEIDRLHIQIAINSSDLSVMKGKLLVVEDRYSRLLQDISNLNGNVMTLIKTIEDNKDRVQKVNIENYTTRPSERTNKIYQPGK